MILFIDVIYANVDLVAGYNRNQMLLFLFNGQIGFYLGWMLIKNLQDLAVNVNRGNLDLLLVKPIPSLFYVTFRKIKVYSILRDSIPPMLAVGIVLDWSSLNLQPVSFLVGIVILLLGVTSAHVIHFLATIPVFWLGESNEILALSFDMEHNIGKIIPFEGYGSYFQIAFTALMPFLITAGVSTSVMLGKTKSIPAFGAAVIITLIFLKIRDYTWKKALGTYTSASS